MLTNRTDLSFTPSSPNLTMDAPALVHPITTYRDYFAPAKSDSYKYQYVKALGPYNLDVVDHTPTHTPQYLGLHILTATNSGERLLSSTHPTT